MVRCWKEHSHALNKLEHLVRTNTSMYVLAILLMTIICITETLSKRRNEIVLAVFAVVKNNKEVLSIDFEVENSSDQTSLVPGI